MDYSTQVIDHFRSPRHAGVLASGRDVATAIADTPGSKAVMQVSLRLSGSAIREARFQAHGCPSTIAAGSWLCEWLRDRPVSEAEGLTAAVIAEALALGPVKRHCAVLAEDALRAALRKLRPD